MRYFMIIVYLVVAAIPTSGEGPIRTSRNPSGYSGITSLGTLTKMDKNINYRKYSQRHHRRLLKSQTEAELEQLAAFRSEDLCAFDDSSSTSEARSGTRHGAVAGGSQDQQEENKIVVSPKLSDPIGLHRTAENHDAMDCNESLDSSLVSNRCSNNFEPDTDIESNLSNEDGAFDNAEAVYMNDESVTPAEKTERFKNELRSWALQFGISHRALFNLMPILGRFTEHVLTVDPRTLLQTPRSTRIVTIGNGNYWHFDFETILKKILTDAKRYTDQLEQIDLIVSIDGLPISDSSTSCFWPILCSENVTKTVHVIGVFHGYTKPDNANEFLRMFVDDITHFINTGIADESRIVRVSLNALICDAPAKSFGLFVKGHTGYKSCTKCTINGVYVDRAVCFPTERISSPLRTDDEFSRGMYKDDYQSGDTILKDIPNFGCVSCVPLDYMHVICLGVMKKLIFLWLKRFHNRGLAETVESKVTNFLLQIRNTVPADFVRKPRAFKDYAHWKATEFRTFLLYLGPVALYKAISQEMYENFLTLNVAIVILCRPDLVSNRSNIVYAEQLLKHFVKTFEEIYGARYMSHNIHNLLHIAEDVRKYGALDEFSAFRFENHMQTLKKLIRKGDKPLQQLARRLHEIETVESLTRNNVQNSRMCCEKEHHDGPIVDALDIKCQFKTIYNDRVSFRCDDKNHCCLLSNGEYVSIMNIVAHTTGELFIIGKQFIRLRSLYENPLTSSTIQIEVASCNTSTLQKWPASEIRAKAWAVPLGQQSFAVFPLLHSFMNDIGRN